MNCLAWFVLWCKVTNSNVLDTSMISVNMMAFIISAGPIILAQTMANLTDKTKRSIFYPFHKDGWKAISGHLLISAVACVLPVFILVHMALSDPGQSAYFLLFN